MRLSQSRLRPAALYSPTVIPMLLAVPAIMLIAASKLAAFRSGILVSAIFCRSALEMVATLVLFGAAEPDLILQYFSAVQQPAGSW